MNKQNIASLGAEQQEVYDAVVNDNQSVMLTGNGGTGKSHTLNAIVENHPTVVTASTGIAALNIGGATIHSWTGLGIGTTPLEKLYKRMREQEREYKDTRLERIRKCECLAIDEISMIEGEFFDLINAWLKLVCDNTLPFGGKQLILSGDFLQLPPIKRAGIARFAFETESWKELNPKVFMLRKTYRQASQEFADILNDIRLGKLTQEGKALLNECFTQVDQDPERPGIELHTHNEGCDLINDKELAKVVAAGEPARTYYAKDTSKVPMFAEALDKNCLAPKVLTLCVGARVMLLKNIDPFNGLANGSLGTVIEMHNKEVHVEFDNGASCALSPETWDFFQGEESVAQREQIPLRLAWAVTIHKSQGMSLDKVYCYLDKCFAQGQAYVALSRATSREGLFLRGGTQIKIAANPRAIKFYQENT